MMPSNTAPAFGPDDELVAIGEEDMLDDDDEVPSSLDHEALTDDAC